MTLAAHEYPEGMVPTCQCSERGTLEPVPTHQSDRCSRCYDVIEWVPDPDAERVECEGQESMF